MIELIDVGKYYFTEFGRHYVFRGVSLVLPPDRSVGVMGPNGAGKSTFLRLVAGADVPSEGSILRSGRISPPMGLTPGLQASLTAVENARFAGRIYGLDRDEIAEMIEYVRETADIGKFFEQPVYMYSAGMKQRVAFAINMSMKFDYYLFDEIGAGGDKEFRQTAREMVFERLRTSKFIMTSHVMRDLLEFCEAGIVIRDGELTYFEDIDEAVKFYGGDDGDDGEGFTKKLERRRAREERRRLRQSEGTVLAIESSATADPPLELETGETATAGEPDREERRRRRSERQSRLAGSDAQAESTEGVEQQFVPDEPPAPAVADTSPEIVPEPGGAPDDETSEAGDSEVADEAAAREQRRLIREERRRLRAESPSVSESAEAAPDETVPAAATGETPVQAEAAEAADAETDSEPSTGRTVRGRRRQRRGVRQRPEAEAVPGQVEDEPPPAPEAAAVIAPPPAEEEAPVTDDRVAVRAARRAAAEERRRQLRQEHTPVEMEVPHADPEPDVAEAPGEPSRAQSRAGRRAAAAEKRRPNKVRGEAAKPPADAVEAGAEYVAEPAAVAHDEPVIQPDSQLPVLDAKPPPDAGTGVPDGDRKLLLLRLAMRQDRAQAKASRAARLLLQHLDAPAGEPAASRNGRAMLVRAAQDIAAAEAAEARALLDTALAGDRSAGDASPNRFPLHHGRLAGDLTKLEPN